MRAGPALEDCTAAAAAVDEAMRMKYGLAMATVSGCLFLYGYGQGHVSCYKKNTGRRTDSRVVPGVAQGRSVHFVPIGIVEHTEAGLGTS